MNKDGGCGGGKVGGGAFVVLSHNPPIPQSIVSYR